MAAFQLRLPVSRLYLRFAVKDANLSAISIEVIQSGLQDLSTCAVLLDAHIVLRANLGHLDHRLSLLECQDRIGETRVDHTDRAVIVDSEKNAGRQQDLGSPLLRLQRLAGCQRRGSDGLI